MKKDPCAKGCQLSIDLKLKEPACEDGHCEMQQLEETPAHSQVLTPPPKKP